MDIIDIKEMLEAAIKERDARKCMSRQKIIAIPTQEQMYNVADTKEETPPAREGSNWDDYWKFHTGDPFPLHCASCDQPIGRADRKGVHIRLHDERNNTKHAWIAICCSSCNKRKGKIPLLKDSKIVETVMTKPHPNYKQIDVRMVLMTNMEADLEVARMRSVNDA